MPSTSALFKPNEGTNCASLLTTDEKQRNYTLLDAKENPKDGLSIADKISPSLNVVAKCDPSKTNPEFIATKGVLTINSDGNCGTYLPIAEFLFKNKWVISLSLILFGIILLFFGGSKWDKLLMLVGFLIGAGGILVILFGFVEIKQSLQTYIVIAFIALIVGILVAALCKTFEVLSYFLLGFLGGYLLSIYLMVMFSF